MRINSIWHPLVYSLISYIIIYVSTKMEFKRANILKFAFLLVVSVQLCQSIKVVKSYSELAEHHCYTFPVETLWRIASGSLSQKYGEQFFDIDCYIRQFVRRDGLVIQSKLENEQQSQQQEEQDENIKKQLVTDPIVVQYAKGLSKCLPKQVNSIDATYAMWRFFRYLVQNDYAYEWMRAKIRATLGYEAERPNSWMDGENDAKRLRLDKLFSNQFYDYIDKLMFKDFMYPLLTFFKTNTVIALSGRASQSGKPILLQSLQTRNFFPKIFEPVILQLNNDQIFSYTVPGFPLLIAGSTQKFAWSFTGVLLDRSNIEEIETVGNKFYHHDTQEWLKLDSQQLVIPGVTEKQCKFMHSAYGPLYTKQDREGKTQEYIVRWHEKQSEVRSLFTKLQGLILSSGHLAEGVSLEFPFNSIVAVNETGIFQYICQQFYPSYFLYPDMFGEPEKLSNRWFSYETKKMLVISNSHLTTTRQQAYDKGQPMSPFEQQVLQQFKSQKDTKYTPQTLIQFLKSVTTTSQLRKQKDLMMKIYRKVKFMYLPIEQHRKKCDLLISLLEKWNGNLDDSRLAPIYILWDYFLRENTFSYISASDYAAHLVKHRLLTDNYWVNQMILWEKGTSYGECDCAEYELMKHEVDGTGHNSSCYLNILRAINQTKDILVTKYQGDFSKINLEDFTKKATIQNTESYLKGEHVQEAFGIYNSRNLFFSAEIGNPKIIYYETFKENKKQVDLSKHVKSQEVIAEQL